MLRRRGKFPFSGRGHTAERHLVTVTLPGVVWLDRAKKLGKVRSLFHIFRLTVSRACDSLSWWSCFGHIVAFGRQGTPRRQGKRKGPGYVGM